MTTRKIGRPTVITEEVLRKLNEVFALGGSDREACLFADISNTALYEYQELHPEFAEHKAALKDKPLLKARRTVVASLESDVNSAWRYVERKDKGLAIKQEIDVTTQGEKITTGESTIIAIAAQAAQLLKENDTNPSTARGT